MKLDETQNILQDLNEKYSYTDNMRHCQKYLLNQHDSHSLAMVCATPITGITLHKCNDMLSYMAGFEYHREYRSKSEVFNAHTPQWLGLTGSCTTDCDIIRQT